MIDTEMTYELHRPKALVDVANELRVQLLLSPEQFAEWRASRDRADTGGAILIGPDGDLKPTLFPGDKVEELFHKALVGGARPCYVDKETGQVHMGEFVFVPVPDES